MFFIVSWTKIKKTRKVPHLRLCCCIYAPIQGGFPSYSYNGAVTFCTDIHISPISRPLSQQKHGWGM